MSESSQILPSEQGGLLFSLPCQCRQGGRRRKTSPAQWVPSCFPLSLTRTFPQTDGPRHLLMKLWVDPNTSFLANQPRKRPRWPGINSLLQIKGSKSPSIRATDTMRSSGPIPSFYGDNITVFLAPINKCHASRPRHLARLH